MIVLKRGETDKQTALREAFRSGYAAKAVVKIMNVVSRRTGVEMYPNTTSPLTYENTYGSFAGYLCATGDGRLLRINFLLNKSDHVHSVDYYEDGGNTYPTFTVEFDPNDNVINIVNTIEAIVNETELSEIPMAEASRRIQRRVDERKKPAQKSVFDWIEDDRRARQDIQDKKLSRVYDDFIEWATENNRLQVSQPSFYKAVKVYLEDNDLENRHLKAGRKKKSARKENIIVDAAEEAQFNQDLEMTYDEQLRQVHDSIGLLRQGKASGLLVTGPPGIGKSEAVFDALEDAGVEYDYVSGNINNAKDLYRYLFYHRQGEFIVLDDVQMSIFKKAREILLAITDMNPEKSHTVSFIDKQFVDPEQWDILTKRQKEKAVPNRFKFTSRIIIITNFSGKKIDKAFRSRAFNVDVDVSNEEIIQKIRAGLEEYFPEYDMEQKEDAVDFLEENMGVFKDIDYRAYYKVLVYRGMDTPMWKKFAFNQLAAS